MFCQKKQIYDFDIPDIKQKKKHYKIFIDEMKSSLNLQPLSTYEFQMPFV